MFRKLFIVHLLFFSFSVFALDNDDISAIQKTVKDLCQVSSPTGDYKNVEVSGGGDVKVKVGPVGLGAAEASVNFTQGEWNGIQQVLREHQASDSKDYRACVRSLVPTFLDKYGTSVDPVESYNVKVKTFPTRANQVSGVTLELFVDGEYVDEISNLRGTQRVSIEDLSKGQHDFTFEDVDGYFVDGFGNYQRHPQLSGMECNGEFYVNRNKTYQLQVYVDNFGNLQCGLK
ncbi:hypothetical protein ND981_01665 [Vibrio diabolicus]|uniref:hypothetical protein n=1 Tax=Vibrio diabolicus TaxID=50719 RepID=UPI00215DE28E|nr:hypothetical protein [Vibrio diabolicus]MCS0331634.1 hypothetical protein [Vibrio diabolicus]